MKKIFMLIAISVAGVANSYAQSSGHYNESGSIYGNASIVTPCSISPASGTTLTLIDESNNFLPLTASTVELDGTFSFDPEELHSYENQNPGEHYRIAAVTGSQFSVFESDSKTINDWIGSSPVDISLAGVVIEQDTLTPGGDTIMDTKTSVTDASGNTYIIIIIITSGSDTPKFGLAKYLPNNILEWIRMFENADEAFGTATCLALDEEGYVYMAGNMMNDDHEDYFIMKFSPEGETVWTKMVVDASSGNNNATGICVFPGTDRVLVIGESESSEGTFFHKVILFQCDTPKFGGHRNSLLANNPQMEAVKFYPNPSDGNLNIALAEGTTGKIELFDLTGQLVYSTTVNNSGSLSLSENSVSNGMYTLKFTSSTGNVQTEKMMIHRGE